MLERLFQIRRGEVARTALLFTYLFLVVTSWVVTKSTRDALFLQRYSAARLPYADIASALAVGAVMAIYIRIGRRVGLRRAVMGSLAAFSASSVGFWLLGRGSEPAWMLPALYVWAGVFGVLLPAQVWTLANYVLTTREAKRLYGVIGSGAISGWIVGGLMTKATAVRLGTETLLLVTGIALAMCPLLVSAIWRQRRVEAPAGPRAAAGDAGPRGLIDSFDLVWRSPYLRAIAAVILLSSLVTTVAAWQFRAIAKHYIPDTDALTAFFGTFNVYAGLLSLATQLFLTSRLLRRFGLGVALLVVPLALAAGSLGVLVWGGIGAAILLKGSDQVLRYSIDRSTVELLYLPVPEQQTFHAKAFIDTVVWRTGDCLGALLVLAGVAALGLTASQISVVTIALLGGWMVAAWTAEQYYVKNLRDSIYEHRIDAERLSGVVMEKSAEELLGAALRGGSADDILYALDLLGNRDVPAPHEAVRRLLDHPASAVRARAIALLAAVGDASVLPRVETMLKDADAGVRAEALVYLSRLTSIDPLARLPDLDTVRGTSVASALAAFFAQPGPAHNLDAVRVLLDAALADGGAEGEAARFEAARLIGWLPNSFGPQLRALLADPSPEVARIAIGAAAALAAIDTAALVVARLGDPVTVEDASHALASFGEAAVPALRDALADERTPEAVRCAIPDVLLRIATPAAEHTLVENLLDGDAGLRTRIVSALNKLRQLHPERRLERDLIETVLAAEIIGHYRSYQMLGRLMESGAGAGAIAPLRTSMEQELERIFRLIKVLYPAHDLHSAYVGLQSASASVRANAVEFLDHILPALVRQRLLPLIDNEVSIAERVRLAAQVVGVDLEPMAGAAPIDELQDAARRAAVRLGDALSGTGSGLGA